MDREVHTEPASQELVRRSSALKRRHPRDRGATTAEYAITTLAACGFAALLVVIMKSEPVRDLLSGVIMSALKLGGG